MIDPFHFFSIGFVYKASENISIKIGCGTAGLVLHRHLQIARITLIISFDDLGIALSSDCLGAHHVDCEFGFAIADWTIDIGIENEHQIAVLDEVFARFRNLVSHWQGCE